MPVHTSHHPGTPSWAELSTTDQESAAAFYGALFGWNRQENPLPDGGSYSMMMLGDHAAAGMTQLDPGQVAAGIPPHWTTYFTVADADATVARIVDAGGAILAPAFDVMDAGRMAVAQDPTGAVFAIWQPKAAIGAEVTDEPGAVTWFELNSTDAARAREFYQAVFGYELSIQDMGDMGEYTTLKLGDEMAAGVMDMPPGVPEGVPSYWLVYFATDDTDATVARAAELGATVLAGPMDIPGVGRFAVLADPQGAALAVLKYAGE